MKKILLVIALAIVTGVCNAEVVREGNTFSYSSSKKAKGDTIVTKYNWDDKDGTTYPIILNKGTGSCYIWKKSSKTGKLYKYYMKAEVKAVIAKEYGVTVKEYKKSDKKDSKK